MRRAGSPDPTSRGQFVWATIFAFIGVGAYIAVRRSDSGWVFPAILVCLLGFGAAGYFFFEGLQRTHPAAAFWASTALNASVASNLAAIARDEWAHGRSRTASFLALLAATGLASVAWQLVDRMRRRRAER